jgi:hypothetical protein
VRSCIIASGSRAAGLCLGVLDAALEHFLGQFGLQGHDALRVLDRKLRHAHGSFHVLAVQFAELFDLACHGISPVIGFENNNVPPMAYGS